MRAGWGWCFWVASWLLACDDLPVTRAAPRGSTSAAPAQPASSGPTELVLIHTADLHSHLFPEPTLIGKGDAARGLGNSGEVDEVGGFARVATLVRRERQSAGHSLYLDSGDLIEGTAAYTAFGGEPEMRALSALEPDAVAIGNHDLDPGAPDFVDKHRRFAAFPLLAANYAAPGSAVGATFSASIELDANGVRVGVIGVGNESSPAGLGDPGNAYGIGLAPMASAVEDAIEALRPSVDVIVAITHLGLNADKSLIGETSGLDVVLGGHQHLALDLPVDVMDCGPAAKARLGCTPRRVVLVHSGALGRYVGRVKLNLAPSSVVGSSDQGNGLEVVSAEHSLLPVCAQLPADPALEALLAPYRQQLAAAGFDTPVAYALGPVERYGVTGGDSPLGNLIADAIRARAGADFALINTTGIRADLPPGVLTKSAFVAALPFSDTLSLLSLTGAELATLLKQQAQVAKSRGCESPLQLSGLRWTVDCPAGDGPATSALSLPVDANRPIRALDPVALYTLVTTDYLADGGSGFDGLAAAATRLELMTDPLDVLLDSVVRLPACPESSLPCLDPGVLRDGRIAVASH